MRSKMAGKFNGLQKHLLVTRVAPDTEHEVRRLLNQVNLLLGVKLGTSLVVERVLQNGILLGFSIFHELFKICQNIYRDVIELS